MPGSKFPLTPVAGDAPQGLALMGAEWGAEHLRMATYAEGPLGEGESWWP